MSNVNKMDKVLEELEALNKAAKVQIEDVPYKNRPGILIAKMDAERRLSEIEKEYKDLLRQRAFTLFVYGDPVNQEKFASIAKEEGGVVVVGVNELYEKLADDCEPAIGAQRQFGGTALGHLIRGIENAARETGTGKLVAVPRLRDVAVVNTREQVVDTVREIVLQDTGHDLNKDYVEHLAFKRAFDLGRSEKVIPVVVLNSASGDGLQQKMFTGRGIEVDVLDVDKEFVLNTFKRVREEASKAK